MLESQKYFAIASSKSAIKINKIPDYFNFDDGRSYSKGMPSSFPPQSMKVKPQATKGSKRLEENTNQVEFNNHQRALDHLKISPANNSNS